MSANAQKEAAPTSPIDRELLERISLNDKAAWKVLVAHFSPQLQGIAIRLSAGYRRTYGLEAGRQFIADLVQATWVHIANSCQRLTREYDPAKGSVSAMLTKVSHNYMIDQLRKAGRSRKREVALEQGLEFGASPFDQEAQQIEEKALVEFEAYAKRELSLEDRELLERVFVGKEDIVSIAEEKGLARNTMDKRFSRLKQKIIDWSKKCLG